MNNNKSALPEDKFFVPVVVLICILGIMFLCVNTTVIYRNRESHINGSRMKSKAQAQLLGENTYSMLYTVDFTLLSLASIIERQSDYRKGFFGAAFRLVETEIKFLPQIQNVVFLDEKGEVDFSIRPVKAFKLASFGEHKDAWLPYAVETVFSRSEKTTIRLSRRIEKQNGDFLGVVVAIIDAGYFYDRYNDYLNVDANAIVLFDNSGAVLTGWFNHPDFSTSRSGANIQSIPYFSSLSQSNFNDGGRRTHEDKDAVISSYQIRSFPYHIAVMHAKSTVLQKWYRETKRDLFIMAATLIVALFTIGLAFRQRQRRRRAELQLLKHQMDLEKTIQQRTRQLDQTNAALVEKNKSLEKALKEIKTLKGIVPICSYCKNIRDDKGYWEKVEVYVKRHSQADFSHSICPDCAKKYFPDMDLYKDSDE